MAISERQAAAIRHKKQRERRQREMNEEQARVGNLMGLTDVQEPGPEVVGWCRRSDFTMKGVDHICRFCQPTKPGLGFEAVYRFGIQATMPCGHCGRRLESVTGKAAV